MQSMHDNNKAIEPDAKNYMQENLPYIKAVLEAAAQNQRVFTLLDIRYEKKPVKPDTAPEPGIYVDQDYYRPNGDNHTTPINDNIFLPLNSYPDLNSLFDAFNMYYALKHMMMEYPELRICNLYHAFIRHNHLLISSNVLDPRQNIEVNELFSYLDLSTGEFNVSRYIMQYNAAVRANSKPNCPDFLQKKNPYPLISNHSSINLLICLAL